MKRREFLHQLGAGSALALLPLTMRETLAASVDLPAFKITEVEILRLTGTRAVTRGPTGQHQVQPLHLYPDRRPSVFKEGPPRQESSTPRHHYLRIRTQGGHEGIYGYVDGEALPTILGPLRRLLIGQDALAIEKLWDQMYRSNRHARASHYMMGISYCDNALWDLRARFLGVPVFRLLGGPTQQPVRVYGSCLGFSIDPPLAAKRAAQLKKDGFVHQKWFLGYGPSDGQQGMDLNVALMRELRAAVGDDVELGFDAYQGWDLNYAMQWCRKVEQYRPWFIEEAFPTADVESFIRLRQGTSVPVATGEHFYNRWEVQQFLKADALHYIQADPEWCGGISEVARICTLASVHGVRVMPHCHNVHAALAIVASQSPAVCPVGEFLINHVPEKQWFIKDPLVAVNGLVTLPEKPGFGIEFDTAKIEKQEILTAL
jgi:L-alanine-DL-glutamate epimerase-like enolase superfamily enzyme